VWCLQIADDKLRAGLAAPLTAVFVTSRYLIFIRRGGRTSGHAQLRVKGCGRGRTVPRYDMREG